MTVNQSEVSRGEALGGWCRPGLLHVYLICKPTCPVPDTRAAPAAIVLHAR